MNGQNITLSDNLMVRPVVMADLETAVDLFNLCALDEIGVASVPLDGIRNEWTLPGFELDTATHELGHALLRSIDMTLVRHFWQMKIELTEPPEGGPLPDGIIIGSMIPTKRNCDLAGRLSTQII